MKNALSRVRPIHGMETAASQPYPRDGIRRVGFAFSAFAPRHVFRRNPPFMAARAVAGQTISIIVYHIQC